MPIPLMAIAAMASAAGTVAPMLGGKKSAKTTQEYKMTPQQELMLQRMTELNSKRLKGIQSPEELNQINAAANQANIGTANAIQALERSTGSGAADRTMQQMLEAQIGPRISATNSIANSHYQQALQQGMQIGLRGPKTGMDTTVPQNNAGQVAAGAEGLGAALSMAGYNKPGATPAAPASGTIGSSPGNGLSEAEINASLKEAQDAFDAHDAAAAVQNPTVSLGARSKASKISPSAIAAMIGARGRGLA